MRLHRQSLTAAEQSIARVLLRDYPEAALLTQREVARAAGVSAPSVSRLAVKLGYQNFDGLRGALRAELRLKLASPSERLRVGGDRRRSAAHALLDEVVELDINNLRQLSARIDPTALERLVERLADSRVAIYVVGSKKGLIPAEYLTLQLNQIRPRVKLLRTIDSLPDDLLEIGANDLLVVFAPRRVTTSLVGAVNACRRAGTEIAVICDELPMPTLASSTYVFSVPTRGHGMFDSYTPMLSLINALLATMVGRHPGAVRNRIDRLEQLNSDLRLWHNPNVE